MGSFAIPAVHEESSLVDEEPTHVEIGEAPPPPPPPPPPQSIFRLCRVGRRRGLKLYVSCGFTYSVKQRGKKDPSCGSAFHETRGSTAQQL